MVTPVLVLWTGLPYISCRFSGQVSEGLSLACQWVLIPSHRCVCYRSQIQGSERNHWGVSIRSYMSVTEGSWGAPSKYSQPSSPFPVVLEAPWELRSISRGTKSKVLPASWWRLLRKGFAARDGENREVCIGSVAWRSYLATIISAVSFVTQPE